MKQKGFALGITVTVIGILPMFVTDIIVIISGQSIMSLNLIPQIELLADIALFVLILILRKNYIRRSGDEKQSLARQSNRGVIAAGTAAFLGALLQILVSIMQMEFGIADTPSPVFGIIGALYLLAVVFILRRNKAGFVLGLIASSIAFLSGFSGEMMFSLGMLIPNTLFAVTTFTLLIINRRKFGKRTGPLFKPAYDAEHAVFADSRYHYRRGDMHRGTAKKRKN